MPGPGGPTVSFTDEELFLPCAALTGGPEDQDHHNLVVMGDGYLWMPWAPEWSGGGVSAFDVQAPCAPVKVGEATDGDLRESHTFPLARKDGRLLTVLDWHAGLVDGELTGGVQFWDLTEATAPVVLSTLALPGYLYPDAYARPSLSAFWAGDTVYVGGADNGVWIVDASDPAAPALLGTHVFEPPLRVGTFHVVGTVGMAAGTEVSRVVLCEVSDPAHIEPLPGGDFLVTDGDGVPKEFYFANLVGRRAWFARKEGAGGPVGYDISMPTAPVRFGDWPTGGGNGGYVFANKDVTFTGDSNFAVVVDFADPLAPVELGRSDITGDLDTATPVGNVVVLSVDEESEPGLASQVVPWATEPDRAAPRVMWHLPADGASQVATTARIGLSWDEMVEIASVHPGSVRIFDEDGALVPGHFTVVEALVNFQPAAPLRGGATYRVEVPAGGVVDVSGNAVVEPLGFSFTVGS
jgi:hypothetical protein